MWRESWRALEALYDQGRIRALGVSNFPPSQLRELLEWARVGPHLVQSWMDPLHQERALRLKDKGNDALSKGKIGLAKAVEQYTLGLEERPHDEVCSRYISLYLPISPCISLYLDRTTRCCARP